MAHPTRDRCVRFSPILGRLQNILVRFTWVFLVSQYSVLFYFSIFFYCYFFCFPFLQIWEILKLNFFLFEHFKFEIF
jgi:hypothetical protein